MNIGLSFAATSMLPPSSEFVNVCQAGKEGFAAAGLVQV